MHLQFGHDNMEKTRKCLERQLNLIQVILSNLIETRPKSYRIGLYCFGYSLKIPKKKHFLYYFTLKAGPFFTLSFFPLFQCKNMHEIFLIVISADKWQGD